MPVSILFRNIKGLCGIQPSDVTLLKGNSLNELHIEQDAFLFIEGNQIVSFGKDANCPITRADKTIDAKGKFILPAFCDSHTHIVFAAWRENEFVQRMRGLSYEEIAQQGGGILNSAARLQVMDEDQLFDQALTRLHEMNTMGTGAVEIKSGYGLTVESEIKMLRVIRRLKEHHAFPIKATFLGAHAMPKQYANDRPGYIEMIIKEMIPQIMGEGLADYIDVFCDKGFYTVDETDQILEAGSRAGLKVKVHANELDYSGGIQVGVKHKAVSVDHLEYTGEDELNVLEKSNTIATILPSTAFFLGLPYAPARKIIERNIAVALASDYNPGTSPSGNMPFVISLAGIKLKMLPSEAINAATLNGASAMDVQKTHGSITISKSASFILTREIPSIDFISYSYGQSWIDKVFLEGEQV